MKPRDLLKLALQIVGVYFLYQSANLLVEWITALLLGLHPAAGVLLQLLFRLMAALYFLRGAPPFLCWAGKEEQTKT